MALLVLRDAAAPARLQRATAGTGSPVARGRNPEKTLKAPRCPPLASGHGDSVDSDQA